MSSTLAEDKSLYYFDHAYSMVQKLSYALANSIVVSKMADDPSAAAGTEGERAVC